MRILIWFSGIAISAGLHAVNATLREPGRHSNGVLSILILNLPFIIALYIDRAYCKAQQEKLTRENKIPKLECGQELEQSSQSYSPLSSSPDMSKIPPLAPIRDTEAAQSANEKNLRTWPD